MSEDNDLLDDDLMMDDDDGQTVEFEDDGETMDIPDDLDDEPSPKKEKKGSGGSKSPLATRGKSTGGNKFFTFLIVFAVLGAGGFGFLEFANPLIKSEDLANGNKAEQQEAFAYFQEQKRNDWLAKRIEGWLKHRRIDSRRYGCRIVTNRALLSESAAKGEAVTKLVALIEQEDTDRLLKIEVLNNLGRLGVDGTGHGALDVLANCTVSNETGRMITDRDLRNHALETLNGIETADVTTLLIAIIGQFESKKLDEISRDDRDLRVKAYRYINERLIASVSATEASMKAAGPDWDLQLDMTRTMLAGYIGDMQPPQTKDGLDLNDHRVRRFSWRALESLTNRRGLQIWGEFLGEKSDKLARTIAVTMLRRVSDRTFGYDPEDAESDYTEWTSWIEAYTP